MDKLRTWWGERSQRPFWIRVVMTPVLLALAVLVVFPAVIALTCLGLYHLLFHGGEEWKWPGW